MGVIICEEIKVVNLELDTVLYVENPVLRVGFLLGMKGWWEWSMLMAILLNHELVNRVNRLI